MNDVLMKGALKMLKNFISPDQIKEAVTSLILSAIEYKDKIELDAAAGENEVIAIFYEIEKKPFFSLAVVNDQNHMIRFVDTKPLDQVIENLISKI